MTNEMIILSKKIELQQQGVLKFTGNKIKVINIETGDPEEIDEIQPIHTFAAWKSLGYRVKKGQKAITRIPIWKYSAPRENGKVVPEDETHKGKMFMKVAAFFSDDQVEKIAQW